MKRTNVSFSSEGNILKGWLYHPDSVSGDAPAIVLTHGFTGVKEQYIDKYAEFFASGWLPLTCTNTSQRFSRAIFRVFLTVHRIHCEHDALQTKAGEQLLGSWNFIAFFIDGHLCQYHPLDVSKCRQNLLGGLIGATAATLCANSGHS